jgi:hypothetical protein
MHTAPPKRTVISVSADLLAGGWGRQRRTALDTKMHDSKGVFAERALRGVCAIGQVLQ